VQDFATLLQPNSLSVFGINFRKGVATPVTPDVAEALEENDRFLVKRAPALVVDAAAAVVVGQSLTPTASQPTSPPNAGKPPTKALRMKAIQVAAADLDINDEGNFTTDGRPSATALTRKLGWQVTSAERDDALKVYAKDTAGVTEHHTKRGGVTIMRRPGTTEPKLLDTADRDLVIEPQTLEHNGGNGLDGQAKPRVRSQAEIDAGALDGEGRREVFSASMLQTHENANLVVKASGDTDVPTIEDEHKLREGNGASLQDDSTRTAVPTTAGGQPASPDQAEAQRLLQQNDTTGAETV
jgi:hypothetical protein